MRKYILLLLPLLAFACIKDNGNYDYRPERQIEITGVPERIDVLANSDRIIINPIFTSKIDGKRIAENDPNYIVTYRMELAAGGKLDINTVNPYLNPSGNWSIDTVANFKGNSYIVELTICDTRSYTFNSISFYLTVATAYREGWLVLCNEGTEKRARLDMISLLGGKKRAIYDVLTPLGMPHSNNAYSIAFLPTLYSMGDRIYVLTKDGCYIPNNETFEINATNPFRSTIKYTDFIAPPQENFVMISPSSNGALASRMDILISESGDAYGISETSAGAIFENPINTDVANTPAKYKVEPFIGQNALFENSSWGIGPSVKTSLFFDKLSKSFVVRSSQTSASRRIMTPLIAPAGGGKLFETENTGMDMVWMGNSMYDNGTTYAVMQDPQGKRHIYGFTSVGTYTFTQSYLDPNITATRFNEAKLFAFSSLFPLTYYAVDNVIYSYNRGDKSSKVVHTLPVGEKVRVLKFNLFKNGPGQINDKSEAFWAQQYNLIVCSYDDTKPGVDNGIVRIMSADGATNTLTKLEEYSGFADIVDIVYRERR